MANIVNVLYNDYVKPYKRYILVLVLIIIFAVAGMYAFKWFAEPMMDGNNASVDNVANANFRGGDAQIYFFFADWCPHCGKAKPHWTNFTSAYQGKSVNGYNVTTIPVDCTDGTDPKIQKYQIQGYPTVIMIKDNQRIDFDSKISEENLTQFINSVLV
jgi:thioredoxin-like negative regulator of GroEL